MVKKEKRIGFEKELEYSLVNDGGYVRGNAANYNSTYAIDTSMLFCFIKESQPKEWERLVAKYGKSNAEKNFLKRLNKDLNTYDMLYLLRTGIVDAPSKIRLCYFSPVSNMNKTDAQNYKKNILSITRNVKYNQKNDNKIDVVLFVNGLPILTLELKDKTKGKTVEHAKQQYRTERDPRELLLGFKSRCLVHFAVDSEEIYMTTKLEGANTIFLPFNKGSGENEPNRKNVKYNKSGFKDEENYSTAYLWEEVLQKDNLLEIIHKFIHLQKKTNNKGYTSELMLFPRYHQWDVVRKLVADVKEKGTGHNYLIQHSAGSGKSNSISWLAHHLQNLHGENNKAIFNSVIVITNHLVLDKQLQETIYQFDHTEGVVVKIDNNSCQLAEALNVGKKIIITTIQKFSFIVEKVKDQRGKNFAVIVDEAHYSQTGASARTLKSIIGNRYEKLSVEQVLQKVSDDEDGIMEQMSMYSAIKNLSFFAFTATPKSKTLQIFGTRNEKGKLEAFHLYSMRQAIEEGFVIDVLKNYVDYDTYCKINTSANPKLKAHNLRQKTQIIIEHVKNITLGKIEGKAKAMVVTSSRLHAVRYYLEFIKYIKKRGYQKDIGVLVAFAGSVQHNKIKYSEYSLNKITETELPKSFSSSKYQILIVAEKYQTGFDEPYLHTMFVDKKLDKIKAVQTLSRLNRTCINKEDTFVLDFVNSAKSIHQAFSPYYKQDLPRQIADTSETYKLKSYLDKSKLYTSAEIEAFAQAFFELAKKQKNIDFTTLNIYLAPAIKRFKYKTKIDKKSIRSNLTKFLHAYSFISNIVRIEDVGLHKFFAYAKLLLKKLPNKNNRNSYGTYEVMLQYYKNQKVFEVSKNPELGKALYNSTFCSQVQNEGSHPSLAELVEKIEDKFDTGFVDQDKILEQIVGDMKKDKDLSVQAKNNSKDHFKFPFNDIFIQVIVDRLEENKAFCEKVLDDAKFENLVKSLLLDYIYEILRE